MTSSEFNKAEIEWANGILSQPEYIMPNGKPSHQVAYEVKAQAVDRMIDTGRINAFGQWE